MNHVTINSERNYVCRVYRTSSQKHLKAFSVNLKDVFFFSLEDNIPSELGNLRRSSMSRLTWQDTAKELKDQLPMCWKNWCGRFHILITYIAMSGFKDYSGS